METDGKIYITISDERGIGDGEKETNYSLRPKKSQEELAKDYLKHQFFSLIKRETTQMVNYTLGNIGNFTGDFNTQRSINLVRKIASIGTSIGTGAIAGSVYGLAGVGALIATVGVITSEATSVYDEIVGVQKTNYSISRLREISGLDTLTNGSR